MQLIILVATIFAIKTCKGVQTYLFFVFLDKDIKPCHVAYFEMFKNTVIFIWFVHSQGFVKLYPERNLPYNRNHPNNTDMLFYNNLKTFWVIDMHALIIPTCLIF